MRLFAAIALVNCRAVPAACGAVLPACVRLCLTNDRWLSANAALRHLSPRCGGARRAREQDGYDEQQGYSDLPHAETFQLKLD